MDRKMTKQEKIIALYIYLYPKQAIEYPNKKEIERKIKTVFSKNDIKFLTSPIGWEMLRETPELRKKLWGQLKEVV